MTVNRNARPCRRPIAVICVLLLTLVGVQASANDVRDVTPKIERVALFKNGLAYVTSFATLPGGAATIKIGQLPVPSHGTFWVSYPKDVEVRALVTSMESLEGHRPARNVADLLQLNTGRKVTISTGLDDAPRIAGTIVDIMPGDTARQSSPLVVIKTENGTVAVNSGSIVRADFEDDDIAMSTPLDSKRPGIRMELKKPADGREIGISYLARGMTWAPSYLIDISDSTTARLSAKAVVINEIADLKGVRLDLVTGFPNIKFADVNSPVAMSENLASFLSALTSGRSSRIGSYIRGGRSMEMMVGQMVEYDSFGDEGGAYALRNLPDIEYSPAQEGTVSEDLFLYPVENLTLLKGETATIPLFTAAVPYKHVYQWTIADHLDRNEYFRDERDSAEVVWHACRLINDMEMPWTTAAAEFVKDGQFTGQDICHYTAPGAETTVRINRALSILAEEAEVELERTRSAANFYGSHYDLVRVKGELRLRNRLNKNVVVEVTKNLSGETLESIPLAEDVQTAKRLQQVNPRHVLTWQVELKSGQEQTVSYTYQVYVRN